MSETSVYRVCGQHPVLGVQPGGRIRAADVPDREQLARMVARGSLEPITTDRSDAVDQSGRKEKD